MTTLGIIGTSLNSLEKAVFLRMISMLKRHKYSVTLLLVSFVIGLTVFFAGTNLEIWRIEYEYKAEDFDELADFQQVDTVFRSKNIFCRNFTSSRSDTLINQGIRRHELKVYLPQPSKPKAEKLSTDLIESDVVNTVNIRYQETQRDKRMILYWTLFGFFLGMIVEFIVALTKKPSSNNNHH